jgi:hypothetical protein
VHCYGKWWKIPLKMVVQYFHPKRGIFHLPGRVEKFHPVMGVENFHPKRWIISPRKKVYSMLLRSFSYYSRLHYAELTYRTCIRTRHNSLYHIPDSNLGSLACALTCKRALNQVSQLGSRCQYVSRWRDYYSNLSRPAASRETRALGTARVADRGKQLIYQLCFTVQFLSSQFAPMKQQF